MKELKEKILKSIEEIEGSVAIYIKDIDSKEVIDIHGKERFHAASMIKVPILWEALRQIDTGELKATDRFSVNHEDKVGGCGVLSILQEGIEVTLKDLLSLMIDVSDNTATNMMIDILGKDRVNQTLRELGLEDTLLARKLMIPVPGVYSYTTASDMGVLFEKLGEGEELNEGSIQMGMEILLAQQLNNRISQDLYCCGSCGHRVGHENICIRCGATMSDVDAVPIRFAHKTGEIVGVVHDGGILYIGNKRIVIVVLTKDLKRNPDGYALLSNIGLIVYEHYRQ